MSSRHFIEIGVEQDGLETVAVFAREWMIAVLREGTEWGPGRWLRDLQQGGVSLRLRQLDLTRKQTNIHPTPMVDKRQLRRSNELR